MKPSDSGPRPGAGAGAWGAGGGGARPSSDGRPSSLSSADQSIVVGASTGAGAATGGRPFVAATDTPQPGCTAAGAIGAGASTTGSGAGVGLTASGSGSGSGSAGASSSEAWRNDGVGSASPSTRAMTESFGVAGRDDSTVGTGAASAGADVMPVMSSLMRASAIKGTGVSARELDELSRTGKVSTHRTRRR